jgi:hypothetical protein
LEISYLFGFSIKPHASDIEWNFPAKSCTGSTKETLETILMPSPHKSLPNIVKKASLTPLL